jgi:tetratricopeptide (TPR) repeat protein
MIFSTRDSPTATRPPTVPRTGRNDPCPCGSGTKYKHCCLEKDRAAQLAPAIAQRVRLQAQQAGYAAQREDYEAALQQAQALDAASNAVVDLVHAGRLDEAEHAARELLVRYPEVHDGYDRLGMVHEARAQFRDAADCYRKVIEFTRANPENHDAGFVDSFLERIVKLEASATEAERAVADPDRFG